MKQPFSILHSSLTILLFSLFVSNGYAKERQRGFAIVIDQKSLDEARNEVNDYAQAVEDVNGLKTFIVVDKWGVPDSIRACLQQMHVQQVDPIEGAILIGDIPVAMIRDAQHLTSAFKMDQRRDRKESSVPSDRYYDDFGMVFKYVDKDSDAPYFYYTLSGDSRQWLKSDIYVGRVRPTDVGGTSRYEKLRRYLHKVVNEKRKQNGIEQILYYSGHGYISESMTARIDEKQGLYEHFPWLRQQQNGIGFMDHSQENSIKFKLMNELMREDLDYAILHHHGAPETQYMNGAPKIKSAEQAKEFMLHYVHNYLRHAQERGKDVDSVSQVIQRRFDIPASWLQDTFDPAVVAKDSLEDDDSDLNLSDFKTYGYKPNCRVVMLDACFNGSFHLDDCIADQYIFGEGQTVVAIANSVNVLQDKWSDRYMGLLGLGMNVGYIPVYSGLLESQCIGDPTFHFESKAPSSINSLLASPDSNLKTWKKLLTSDYPDFRCMAIEQLHRANAISSEELLQIFKTTPYAIVRIQALTSLAENNDDFFIEAIRLGVNDSYEMVQRFALRYLWQNGDPRLKSDLMSICISNNTSERCNFNAMNALSIYPEDELIAEFERQFNNEKVHYVKRQKVHDEIENAIRRSAKSYLEEIDEIVSTETTDKRRRTAIRTTRNYCPYYRIPELFQRFRTTTDAEEQQMLLESLGWRNFSYQADSIASFAKEISENSTYAPSVREEALKTYRRITRK